MPEARLLLARYVVPVRPRGVVLEDHAVLMEGGKITSILPANEAVVRHPDATPERFDHHVLLPGLINMHTHSPMSLLRGYADDLALETWLRDHIWPAEQRWLSPEFVADGTRLAVAEMIRCGTTCFNDMYFFPDVTASVVEEVGLRACIGLPIIEFPTAWARDFEAYIAKALQVHDALRGCALVSTALAPHAAYTVTDDMLARVAELSATLELPVHIHLLEIAWEARHSLQEYGMGPLQRLLDVGLLNERLIAVHMAHLQDEDIRLLAESGVNVVHCPESNLKLASGFCRVADLLAAGVNVALGTDGAASNNDLDLLAELRTAALLAKGVAADPCALSAGEALELVTINAAQALGLGETLGSIEVGKQADLCAVDLDRPQSQPVHHVISQLVYAATSAQVSDVWVGGRRLLEGGALTALDLPQVIERAECWRQRMVG
ncbi:MAG: TRZ/ATZ family hydrolase [Xanthomonadales bacterium]|nr:TRZ/ATZ family hydrolase [Xanthomonadales bacterium]NIN60682.1 TRZ/ATZ family hydrolase [Xanthomonadales bacterium]NIN76044.1 TRZ/ATZ family hydrolase [Xanthomonadales bacterium]NIO14352.1 TRZ/ATZ family hydrolase [Xanthomonadales bacterium]NIP13075.1 TRZ/ATZ family hydrolase [Xanthomonadales bacterium]